MRINNVIINKRSITLLFNIILLLIIQIQISYCTVGLDNRWFQLENIISFDFNSKNDSINLYYDLNKYYTNSHYFISEDKILNSTFKKINIYYDNKIIFSIDSISVQTYFSDYGLNSFIYDDFIILLIPINSYNENITFKRVIIYDILKKIIKVDSLLDDNYKFIGKSSMGIYLKRTIYDNLNNFETIFINKDGIIISFTNIYRDYYIKHNFSEEEVIYYDGYNMIYNTYTDSINFVCNYLNSSYLNKNTVLGHFYYISPCNVINYQNTLIFPCSKVTSILLKQNRIHKFLAPIILKVNSKGDVDTLLNSCYFPELNPYMNGKFGSLRIYSKYLIISTSYYNQVILKDGTILHDGIAIFDLEQNKLITKPIKYIDITDDNK